LKVIRIFKDGLIQVDTRSVEDYLNNELFFYLRIKKPEIVEGIEELIPTREIAICKLKNHSSHSIFKILKWIKLNEYKTDFKDLKKNKNLDVLKPFIDLKPEYLADRCSLQDLENVKSGLDNLIRIQAGE